MNHSKKITSKYLTYIFFFIIIFSFSGCSFLFPSSKRRLATIKREYQKLQMDFDVTINAPFSNDDIEKLEEEYKELFEEADALLKEIRAEEAKGAKPNVTSDMAKEYYDKIYKKIVICEDLKD